METHREEFPDITPGYLHNPTVAKASSPMKTEGHAGASRNPEVILGIGTGLTHPAQMDKHPCGL